MNRVEVNAQAEILLQLLRGDRDAVFDCGSTDGAIRAVLTDDVIRKILTAAVRKLGKLSELKTPEPEEVMSE